MRRRSPPYQTAQRCHECGEAVPSGWPMIIHLSVRHRQEAAPMAEPEPDWEAELAPDQDTPGVGD